MMVFFRGERCEWTSGRSGQRGDAERHALHEGRRRAGVVLEPEGGGGAAAQRGGEGVISHAASRRW